MSRSEIVLRFISVDDLLARPAALRPAPVRSLLTVWPAAVLQEIPTETAVGSKIAQNATALVLRYRAHMSPAIRDGETYEIIGAAMEVHRILGHGFLESVYRAALKSELSRRSVPAAIERRFHVEYKGERLPVLFKPDLVCFDRVIVETKATAGLGRVDMAQAINYLRVSGLRKALLLNFGTTCLEYKRIVL